tara:strand:+ start:436 stop:909 length:474 start_codon:yes stop_codon:yes gene_type:complete
MTQYIKHYYKKTSDDTWITSIKKIYNSTTNQWSSDTTFVERRKPDKEYPGLGTKVWILDSEGVDICLSDLPDSTSVENVSYDNKKVVQILNEDQFNSVKDLVDASNNLNMEANELGVEAELLEEGSDEKNTKLEECETKLQESKNKFEQARSTLYSF